MRYLISTCWGNEVLLIILVVKMLQDMMSARRLSAIPDIHLLGMDVEGFAVSKISADTPYLISRHGLTSTCYGECRGLRCKQYIYINTLFEI